MGIGTKQPYLFSTWRREKFLSIFTILFIATLAFDRLDLFFGFQQFRITPSVFFSITAPVLLLIDLFITKKVNLHLSKRIFLGYALILFFIMSSAVSLLINTGSTKAFRQLVLLVILIVGTYSLLTIVLRYGLVKSVQRGAFVAILLFLFFDVLQFFLWLTYGAGAQLSFGPVNLYVPTLGNFAPRPSGLSLDPTRGALAVFLFTYLLLLDPIFKFGKEQVKYSVLVVALSGLVVVLTGSRTVIPIWMVICIVWIVANMKLLTKYKKIVTIQQLRINLIGKPWKILIAVGSLLVTVVVVKIILDRTRLGQLILERFNFSAETSAGIHLQLIIDGISLIIENPSILVSGVGFGASSLFLDNQIFGGKPGNFHSQFLTAAIENGLVGLISLIALILIPIFSKRWVLALGILIFSISYQAHLDATFWFIVALMWIVPSDQLFFRRSSLFLDAQPFSKEK